MDQHIESKEVSAVSISHTGNSPCHLISTFIHHSMTPEREQELANFLETAIMVAIKGFLGS